MNRNMDRREFLALIGVAGAGLLSSCAAGSRMSAEPVVPRRVFGRTGVRISRLCLGGGSFMAGDGQALLDEALKHGVDCWEIVSFTGPAYADYFKAHPEVRERVFLSGKVRSTDPAVMQEQLDKSLRDNGTEYVDFLAVHVIDDVKVLNDDVRRWAEKAKREKKIRLFGFCTHKNMADCLDGACELGWIDGVQTVYSYRMRSIKSMEDAMQRCRENGVGLFAIKTMGLCVQRKAELDKLPLNEERLSARLAPHAVSFEQAKLKAIWQNPNLTSVCSLMPTAAILRANALAAMDERPLNSQVRRLLADYAEGTGRYFCRRCGTCDTANADKIPIFDIMEILMYSRAYGWRDSMVEKFATIPVEMREKINTSDYTAAEDRCPQKMPIALLMREAYAELSSR